MHNVLRFVLRLVDVLQYPWVFHCFLCGESLGWVQLQHVRYESYGSWRAASIDQSLFIVLAFLHLGQNLGVFLPGEGRDSGKHQVENAPQTPDVTTSVELACEHFWSDVVSCS